MYKTLVDTEKQRSVVTGVYVCHGLRLQIPYRRRSKCSTHRSKNTYENSLSLVYCQVRLDLTVIQPIGNVCLDSRNPRRVTLYSILERFYCNTEPIKRCLQKLIYDVYPAPQWAKRKYITFPKIQECLDRTIMSSFCGKRQMAMHRLHVAVVFPL